VMQAMLDERKFEYLSRHGKKETKQRFKETAQSDKFSKENVPEEHRATVWERINTMSTDPRWNPTEGEKKQAEVRETKTARKIVLPGSPEYQETEEELRKRLK